MEWAKKRKKPADDEEAKLNDALLEFQADFGQGSSSSQPKSFLRGNVVEGNKSTNTGGEGSVYAPKFKMSISSNVGSKDLDEAKKLAAAKARRMLEDAARSKKMTEVPKVVLPSTKPLQRPPKPGSSRAKQEKAKMSQMEQFKMELQRVQEDREKRKDLRQHLEKVGMDHAVVERLAPTVERGFQGSSEFDDDPYTTNVYVSNIPHSVTEQDLLFTFGSFGPLAALKILYPRSEEERRRPHICAFVAFMSRSDVDRFMAEVRVIIIRNEPIRFAFARPVQIPAVPHYTPPVLQDLQHPDPTSGLPFNAQPEVEQAKKFLKLYKSFPPLNMLPCKGQYGYDDFVDLMRNSIVRVVIPPDRKLVRIMDRMAVYVCTEGPQFEALICADEYQNPMFQFLWDNTNALHVYYRWRIYALLQGDSLKDWHREPFRMFENGSWWIPPYPLHELREAMPQELYQMNCLKSYPEKWMKVRDGGQRRGGEKQSSRSRQDSEDEREERRINREEERERKQREKAEKKRKNRMSEKRRSKLETILQTLTVEKTSVGTAMVWCIMNAKYAAEIAECILESLVVDDGVLNKKIAKLYLINDILSNCDQKIVRDAHMYRLHFQNLFEKIFACLGTTYRSIQSRFKGEAFKVRVIHVFNNLESLTLYPTDKLILNQNIFLGLVEYEKKEVESEARKEEEDEDLDGVPLDDDKPMRKEKVYDDEDDIDGIPMEEVPKPPTTIASKFKPVESHPRDDNSPIFSSKWDHDGRKSNEDDEDEDLDGIAIPESTHSESASLSPGEIKETNVSSSTTTSSGVLASGAQEERRRQLKRDVEVRALAMQDDLEVRRDPDARRKVEEFKKAEMEKVERILATKGDMSSSSKRKSEERRIEKKDKKKKRSRSRDRDRDRDRSRRDRSRDRSRDRERSRDRDRRDRDRDRDRERDRDRRYR